MDMKVNLDRSKILNESYLSSFGTHRCKLAGANMAQTFLDS